MQPLFFLVPFPPGSNDNAKPIGAGGYDGLKRSQHIGNFWLSEWGPLLTESGDE